MAVRMIKKSWWVDFRFDHTRYRKRSPENSRAGALAYEATLRHKLSRGEPISATASSETDKDITFECFAWRWFELYVKTNNKYSEQYAKQKILKASIVPFFRNVSLSSITTEHVERFTAHLKAQGISNKTINNRLAILGKCMRCAQDWHGISVPTIKPLKCLQPVTDYLTPSECETLLGAADGQLLTMVLLALRTGMRQGELRGLQWPSIDWHNQSVAVRHSQCDRSKSLVSPKSNRERHIPLDVDVRNLLYPHKKDSGYVFLNPATNTPYTSNRLVAALQILCKKAGIRKIGWHVLRHTFATQLTLGGTPVPIVKELLGHSSIEMTMRYSHVATPALRAAIESLNPRAQLSVGNPWATTS